MVFTERELQVLKHYFVLNKGLGKTADALNISVTRVRVLRDRIKVKLSELA